MTTTSTFFYKDKALRKVIMKIETDSKGLEEVKNPDTCNVFALYNLLGNEEEISQMRKNYLEGNYGYGHAKQALFDLIIKRYEKERKHYWELMENPKKIDDLLEKGAAKARKVAKPVLEKVRKKLGYSI